MLKTRKPTGQPAWPMILIAGPEKTGKTYAAAEASASEHIGRTFWFAFGEDEPDEFGGLPGARLEIVQHDGTIPGLLTAIAAAKAEPTEPGKPNMLVLDSATRLWNFCSDLAQAEANQRKKREDADITMDLWNKAKARHGKVVDALRTHAGPVILTARMEIVTVMDAQGRPTSQKDLKVQTEKTLPYDVGAIVRIPERGSYELTGVRSLRIQIPDGKPMKIPGFTVDELWKNLGLFDGAPQGQRHQEHLDGTEALQRVAQARAAALAELQQLYVTEERMNAADKWWLGRYGHQLHETEDIAALQDLVAEVRKKAEAAATPAPAAEPTPEPTQETLA